MDPIIQFLAAIGTLVLVGFIAWLVVFFPSIIRSWWWEGQYTAKWEVQHKKELELGYVQGAMYVWSGEQMYKVQDPIYSPTLKEIEDLIEKKKGV